MSRFQKKHTTIPDDILAALARFRIPGEQSQCLHFILLQTAGNNKRTAAISISDFEKATGLHRKSVCRALNSLNDKKIIHIEKGGGLFTTVKTSRYRFNERFNAWRRGGKKSPRNTKGAGRAPKEIVKCITILTS